MLVPAGGPCLTQLGQHTDYPLPCSFYTILAPWVIGRAEVDLHLYPPVEILRHGGCELASSVGTDARGHFERQTQVQEKACDPFGFLRGEIVYEQEPKSLVHRLQQVLVTCLGRVGDPQPVSLQKPSHGSRYLAGSITIRWLRVRFLRRHPRDKAYSLAFLHIPGQWKRSRSSACILPTPGCPCW